MDEFITDEKDFINDFNSRLISIYNFVFGERNNNNGFSLTASTTEEKLKIEILPDEIYSHGKNQGRTLVYDLAVLFNMIDKNLKGPRFLIHDGIFDSLDTSHFINLYNFCEQKKEEGYDFQYIVTLNQSDSIDHSYGYISEEEILKKTALTISAKEKLLGDRF